MISIWKSVFCLHCKSHFIFKINYFCVSCLKLNYDYYFQWKVYYDLAHHHSMLFYFVSCKWTTHSQWQLAANAEIDRIVSLIWRKKKKIKATERENKKCYYFMQNYLLISKILISLLHTMFSIIIFDEIFDCFYFAISQGFSCVDLQNAGMRQSGVYYLQIRGTTYWFLKVYCEQDIADGGWTVSSHFVMS